MSPHSTPRIGIIIGSTREGRFGDKPARWISGIAAKRTDMQFELIDLRDYPLPFFEEQMSPSTRRRNIRSRSAGPPGWRPWTASSW